MSWHPTFTTTREVRPIRAVVKTATAVLTAPPTSCGATTADAFQRPNGELESTGTSPATPATAKVVLPAIMEECVDVKTPLVLLLFA